MIPILFPETETSFSSGGLGRLADCISCSVQEELNGIFECEFRYPVDGPMYAAIQPGTIIVCSYDVSGDLQPFDIYAREINLDGTATYRAHHISYRLNTIMYRPGVAIDGYMKAASSIWNIIDRINGTYAGRLNNLKYGSPTFSTSGYSDGDPPYINIDTSKMMSLREIIMGGDNSIVGKGGAEIKWNKLACTFHKRRGSDTSAIIRYGSNLSAMRYEYDNSAAVDAVIPYWKDSETVYLMDTLDSTATSYPSNAIAAPCPLDHVYTLGDNFSAIPLDVSSQFGEKPTADDVYDYAYTYYNVNAIGRAYENLSIDIVPLWDAPEYKYIAQAEKLLLGDTVTAAYPEFRIVKPMRLVKTVWDPLIEKYTAMEFGTVQRTLYNVNIAKGTQELDPDVTYVDMDDGEIEEVEVGE